jgi:thiol:disulfide interchange protein DsbC
MKLRLLFVHLVLAVATLVSASANSAPSNSAPAKADPRADIARRLEVPVKAVRESVIPGLFEVANGGEVIYVSTDGRYAIKGDVFDTDRGRNITDHRRNEARQELLRGLSDDETVVFSPAKPRYTVTVFTDVECKFCRMFHNEIAEYNRLGVKVRYAFYPRPGPGSDAWRKAEAVWCSGNRQETLTAAIQGNDSGAPKGNCRTPVARTYELGKTLGMMGTPGIFTDRGEYITGYRPPAQLVEQLRAGEAHAE